MQRASQEMPRLRVALWIGKLLVDLLRLAASGDPSLGGVSVEWNDLKQRQKGRIIGAQSAWGLGRAIFGGRLT
jgi:hypothetical protein